MGEREKITGTDEQLESTVGLPPTVSLRATLNSLYDPRWYTLWVRTESLGGTKDLRMILTAARDLALRVTNGKPSDATIINGTFALACDGDTCLAWMAAAIRLVLHLMGVREVRCRDIHGWTPYGPSFLVVSSPPVFDLVEKLR